MSRSTVGWLRVALFPERVRRTESQDVTAVLPDPPKNGQYPAWVYVLCSFLVCIDYIVVGIWVLVLGFALSVNGVPLPDGRVGGLATVLVLAVAVQATDSALSKWRASPLDEVVRQVLAPARGMIRSRLVTFEMVSPRDVASTARPTPVIGFTDTSDDRTPVTGTEVTMWGSTGVFPPEERAKSRLSFEEGERFQSYRLISKVGQGGISVVWRAEDVETGETIALKIFDSSVDEDTRRTFKADFIHEAKVLRSLRDHEHIIRLYDSGYKPFPWIAVEYVEAGTIRDQLPVSLPVALTVILAVAEALEYSHGKDISHTDLKPENVLYSEDYFGRLVLVTDWGKRPVVNPDLEPMLSRPYAAPEQFDARPTNEPEAELIDIYQLGLLAYELFTGTQPFLTGEDTVQRVRAEVPPPPSDHISDLPGGLDEVILTAIEKQPGDRYKTVAEFRSELLETTLPDLTPGDSALSVGHPKDIRTDEDWGRHGNKRLHDWAFDTVLSHIEYKAEERGIEVERVDEYELATSITCCACGMKADSNRVERGLYVCENCELVANSDLNAAENMRATVTPSPSVDRSNGCLAQPSVRLFDKQTGRVAPQEQVCP